MIYKINRKHGTFPRPSNFVEHPIFLNGLTEYISDVRENILVEKSQFVRVEGNAVKFTNFQPGSIIVFRFEHKDILIEFSYQFHYS